jgi:hypothetical protein
LSLEAVYLWMPTDINGNSITDINLLQLAKDYAYPSALVIRDFKFILFLHFLW